LSQAFRQYSFGEWEEFCLNVIGQDFIRFAVIVA